jgi:RNA polymerase sigma-70 factor (ECF subfamily)
MDNQELNQLAKQAKSGDHQAFGRLFDILAPSIHRFLFFRVKDPAVAEDLTGQVWLEVWQSLKRFDPNRSFKTWIFTIARYILIDHYRRRRPAFAPLDSVTNLPDQTDIEAETGHREETAATLQAIDRLPELYQTVLKLKFIEEMDYAEIAEVTGKTENNLRVIVKRGLDKLRNLLNSSS